MIQTQIPDGDCTGTLAGQRDIPGIPAGVRNMIPGPFQDSQLNIRHEISVSAVFFLNLFMRQISANFSRLCFNCNMFFLIHDRFLLYVNCYLHINTAECIRLSFPDGRQTQRTV